VSSKTSWKTQDKDKEGMKDFSVLHPQLGGSKKLGASSPGSNAGGRLFAPYASLASWPHPIALFTLSRILTGVFREALTIPGSSNPKRRVDVNEIREQIYWGRVH